MNEEEHQAVSEATQSVFETGERVVYSSIAFLTTFLAANQLFYVEHEHALEIAFLNAGVAYYTHSASSRVIRALYIIAKSNLRKP